VKPGNSAQQGGFATSTGAKKGKKRTGFNAQFDIGQGNDIALELFQPGDFHGRHAYLDKKISKMRPPFRVTA